MKTKRDRLEIFHDMLKAINNKNGKIKPTHLMYKSNLSHSMLNEYLVELIKRKFIEEIETNEGKSYIITKAGLEYIEKYSSIIKFVDSFGLEEDV
ncbi:MAG TPA: winged helix-turn-helix domain-containing protein [Candidatus Nanoarchaeia archaeon]|nr:winged helix-turn-helix domain-containing protein [Candidatus Nanoarchaeia archaeon]